jgi:hypothetical protein
MKIPMRAAATALLLCGVVGAQAQKLSPGLWENTASMQSADGKTNAMMAQAQEAMAKMPPDQRKMMQDMMAKNGVGMGPQGNTIRVCMSAAQAERVDIPQGEGNCTQQAVSRSGNTMKFKFSCAGEHPSSGEGEFTVVGDKAYNGRTVVNTTVKGKPEQMTMTVSGKWISADCGGLKPRQ